jgi:Ca2+-binding RTX toxin-like protein
MPKSLGRYTLSGSSGDDNLDGSLLAQSLQDRGLNVNGNGGNDTIRGGSGADLLSGGNGNDYVYGALDDLTGSGTIVWDGGNGTDTLDLSQIPYAEGTGTMVAFYGNGDSQIRTSAEKDDGSLAGPTSWDSIFRGNFKNFENFVLGAGNDTVLMTTSAVNNVIDGGGGNDLINAGAGNDTVYGGDGDDILEGGWGNDIISGGAGSDLFSWQGRLAGQYTKDVITDFDVDGSDGVVDHLWLGGTWAVSWGQDSQGQLVGYLSDNGTVFGDVTFVGLTLADAALIQVYHGMTDTGFPGG